MLKMNRTVNVQKAALDQISHAIYQSHLRKDKITDQCIDVLLRYVEAAVYLSKCTKFGEADESGGVVLRRMRELDSSMVNIGNGADRKLETLTEMVEGIPPDLRNM